MSEADIINLINNAIDFSPTKTNKSPELKVIDIREFLTIELPPREQLLSPIIPTQGLVMIYAARGIGKTFVSLSIATAVASGSNMFADKWICEKPHKVLFIDGEMPATVLQERLSSIVAGLSVDSYQSENLKIITPDLQERGIPDLATLDGQELIEMHLDGVELLILDNLSSLCRTGRENESESWLPIQEWLLSLRKRNISVLIIHHAGKGGNQRGNSKKEDLLDTVIALKKPGNYEQKDGARFEVHYEKARGFHGDEAKPFEATIVDDNGVIVWVIKEIEDSLIEQVIELHNEEMSQREIGLELGISASKVNRLLKKAKSDGKL